MSSSCLLKKKENKSAWAYHMSTKAKGNDNLGLEQPQVLFSVHISEEIEASFRTAVNILRFIQELSEM